MAYPGTDRLRGYQEEIDFALECGDGPTLRESRTRISTLSLTASEQHDLWQLDEMVVETVMEHDDLQPYLLEDDPTRPLAQWWWHLGKLRAGTYPAELLPSHLRAIYRPAQRAAA